MKTACIGPPANPATVEVGLERVDLAPERVAAHVDVEHTEAALVVAPVEHVGGEQDHARAGSQSR